MASATSWGGGGGGMQVFMLTVLPEHSAQVPVLAKNVTLDRGEDHPRQNDAQVFLVPK